MFDFLPSKNVRSSDKVTAIACLRKASNWYMGSYF